MFVFYQAPEKYENVWHQQTCDFSMSMYLVKKSTEWGFRPDNLQIDRNRTNISNTVKIWKFKLFSPHQLTKHQHTFLSTSGEGIRNNCAFYDQFLKFGMVFGMIKQFLKITAYKLRVHYVPLYAQNSKWPPSVNTNIVFL